MSDFTIDDHPQAVNRIRELARTPQFWLPYAAIDTLLAAHGYAVVSGIRRLRTRVTDTAIAWLRVNADADCEVA